MAAYDLDKFDPATAGRYDPGHIQIFYDNRRFKGFDDKLPMWQNYWLEGLSYLGRPAIWTPTDLYPGFLRIIFYTHEGTEGQKDFPIHKAVAVKEMFDDLSREGYRPMVLGYSSENPFPELGGTEPKQPTKKSQPKRATTWSHAMAGHQPGSTPHDRIMTIIQDEEEKEAKLRQQQAEYLEEKFDSAV